MCFISACIDVTTQLLHEDTQQPILPIEQVQLAISQLNSQLLVSLLFIEIPTLNLSYQLACTFSCFDIILCDPIQLVIELRLHSVITTITSCTSCSIPLCVFIISAKNHFYVQNHIHNKSYCQQNQRNWNLHIKNKDIYQCNTFTPQIKGIHRDT